jgi:hypothetical protein
MLPLSKTARRMDEVKSNYLLSQSICCGARGVQFIFKTVVGAHRVNPREIDLMDPFKAKIIAWAVGTKKNAR